VARFALAAFFVLAATYAVVLVWVVARRLGWPFEIEWMEGGELTHAARIALGKGIYVRPSASFVPFFYTPLYPMVLAGLSKLGAPLGFGLGRAVSALATLATLALLYAVGTREAGRPWGLLAACLYAALFRFCGAFYDVVRPDALALGFALGAAACARWARGTPGMILAAALVVLAFFSKQTTAVFAVPIALCVFARDRRLGLIFGGSAVAMSGLAAWGYDRATDGWFWLYIFEGHQGHRFLWGNFVLEYWRDVLMLAPILVLFPALALSYGRVTRWISAAFVALLVAAFVQRALTIRFGEHMYYRELWYQSPRAAVLLPPLIVASALAIARLAAPQVSAVPGYWLAMAAAGALASALNHSTQWANANCFMPIALFGSLAVALSVRAFAERGGAAASSVAIAGIVQLVALAYNPFAQVPSDRDRAALAVFLRRVSSLEGPLFIGAHPFLAFQKNGSTHLHHMSIGDVDFRGGVSDLKARIDRGEWRAAIVDENTEMPALADSMYVSDRFSYSDGALFPKTGFKTRPLTLWRMQDPGERSLAPGISGNFEGGTYAGWTPHGSAFGGRPSTREELAGLRGLQGVRAASSRAADGAGQLESAPFVLDAPRLTLLVAGARGSYVRAMHGEEEIARVQPADAHALVPKDLELTGWVGQTIRIQIVDEETSAMGESHTGIVVDDLRASW
jgi:hypothetical protein